MKNLQSFNEFLNESELNTALNEGALAMKASRELEGVDVFIEEFEDKEVKDLHKGICDLLGEDPSNVFRVDSESNDEDPLLKKIYNFLSNHLNPESVDADSFYELSMGEDIGFDKDLNAVRYDDHGFVAFFFTAKSKF